MILLTVFLIAFLFSFVGSIPPGSINLSVLQLALNGKHAAGYRFALASALVEFPYAIIAIKFENVITSTPWVEKNFQIISTAVMLTLGIVSLIQNSRPRKPGKLAYSGFRKGIIISILNPLAIPFWIGVTAYLHHQGWIELSTNSRIIFYALGISAGTFTLLSVIVLLASKIGTSLEQNKLVRLTPALLFLLLGIYGLYKIVI